MRFAKTIFTVLLFAQAAMADNVRNYLINPYTGAVDTNRLIIQRYNPPELGQSGIVGVDISKTAPRSPWTNFFDVGWYSVSNPVLRSAYIIRVDSNSSTVYDATQRLYGVVGSPTIYDSVRKIQTNGVSISASNFNTINFVNGANTTVTGAVVNGIAKIGVSSTGGSGGVASNVISIAAGNNVTASTNGSGTLVTLSADVSSASVASKLSTNNGTLYNARIRFTAEADTLAGLSVSNAANNDADITFNDQLQNQGGYIFNGVVQSSSGFYGNLFGDMYGPMKISAVADTNIILAIEGGTPIMSFSVPNDGVVFPRGAGGDGRFLTNILSDNIVGVFTNTSIPVFPSIAAMISAGLSNDLVKVIGYWGTNTWGGGEFRLRTGVTLATNYGTIFTNKTGATGTAGYRERVRESTNTVNVADFGIFPVTATDPAGALVRQDARFQNAIDCVPISGGRVSIPPFNFNIGTIYLTNKFGCEFVGEAGGGRASLYVAQTRPIIGYNGPAGATNWILHGSGGVTFRNIGFDTRPTVHANVYPTLLTNYAQIVFDVDQPATHAFTTTQNQWENCKFYERGTNTNLRFVRIAYGSWQNCEFMRFKNCSFSGNGWKGDYWYAYTNTGGIAISCGEGGGGANSYGNVIEDCDFDSCYSYLSSSNGTWSVRGGWGTGGVISFFHSGAGPMIINNDFRDEGFRQFVVAANAKVHISDCQLAAVDGYTPLPFIDATSIIVENTKLQGSTACYVTNSFTSTGFLKFDFNLVSNLDPTTAVAWGRFGSSRSSHGSFSTHATKNWQELFPLSTWDATLVTNKMVLDYVAGATPSLLLMPDHGRLGFGRTPLSADFWINLTNTSMNIIWADSSLNPRYRWHDNGNQNQTEFDIVSGGARESRMRLIATNGYSLDMFAGFSRAGMSWTNGNFVLSQIPGTASATHMTVGPNGFSITPTNSAGYFEMSIAGSNAIYVTQSRLTLSNAIIDLRGIVIQSNTAAASSYFSIWKPLVGSETYSNAANGDFATISSTGFIGDGSQIVQLNAAAVGSGVLGSTHGGAGTVNGILSANGLGDVSATTSAQIQTALGGQAVTNGATFAPVLNGQNITNLTFPANTITMADTNASMLSNVVSYIAVSTNLLITNWPSMAVNGAWGRTILTNAFDKHYYVNVPTNLMKAALTNATGSFVQLDGTGTNWQCVLSNGSTAELVWHFWGGNINSGHAYYRWWGLSR